MQPHRTFAVTLAALVFALGASAPALAADTHAHGAAAPSKLTLDHGKKWTTDAPLRQRMGEIRALLAPQLGPIHAGKLPSADYQALSVRQAVHLELCDLGRFARLGPWPS